MKTPRLLFALFVVVLLQPHLLYSQIVTVPGVWDQWCYVPVQVDMCDEFEIGGYLAYILPDGEKILGGFPYQRGSLPAWMDWPISCMSAVAVIDNNRDLWLYDLERFEWSGKPALTNVDWVWSGYYLDGVCSGDPYSYYFAISADTLVDSSTIYFQTAGGERYSLGIQTIPNKPEVSFYWDGYTLENYSPANYCLWWTDRNMDSLYVVGFDSSNSELYSYQLAAGCAWQDSTKTVEGAIADLHYTPGWSSNDWVIHATGETTWYLSRWHYYYGVRDTVAVFTSDTPPQLTLPHRKLGDSYLPTWTTHTEEAGWQIHYLDRRIDSVWTIDCSNRILDLQSEEYFYRGGYPGSMWSSGGLKFMWSEYDSSNQSTSLYGRSASFTSSVPEDGSRLPELWTLSPTWPNPFNGTATVQLALSRRDHVKIELFNIVGQRVKLVSVGVREPGISTIAIDAEGLASGIYFVRARTHDGSTQSRRITLLR